MINILNKNVSFANSVISIYRYAERFIRKKYMSIFNRDFILGTRPVKEAVMWKEAPDAIPSKFTARIADSGVKIVLVKNFGTYERIVDGDKIEYDARRDVIIVIDPSPHVLPWGVGDGYYTLNGRRYRVRANGSYTVKITNEYDFLRWSTALRYDNVLTSQDVKKRLGTVILPVINKLLTSAASACAVDNYKTLSADLTRSLNDALTSFAVNCGTEISEVFINSVESVAIVT